MNYQSVSIIKNIEYFFYQISKSTRYKLFFCLILMVIVAVTDLIRISLIIPFLGLLLSPEKILNYETFIPPILKI